MIKKFNFFMFFLVAPVLGFCFAFYETNPFANFEVSEVRLPLEQMDEQVDLLAKELDHSRTIVSNTKQITGLLKASAGKQYEIYQQQSLQLDTLVAASKVQTQKSDEVLEQVLSNLLGEPIGVTNGKRAVVKIYSLVEAGYRGFMAKVTIKDSSALKLVLADDKVVSNGETTSEAAKRKNAVLAVNAGGFWKTEGKIVPLGITVVDGKIKTFYDTHKLPFVGFNKRGHLTGGMINSERELKQLDVLQGASFKPILLEDGKKMEIPSDWANTKHPRTIVGNFSNGELLFIVIDGRRQGWSSGVTLEDAQEKLLSFKVKDAFNLDGGGSSAFYYNGDILNLPSDGRERPVTSNLVIIP